jgi:hypothetical protein
MCASEQFRTGSFVYEACFCNLPEVICASPLLNVLIHHPSRGGVGMCCRLGKWRLLVPTFLSLIFPILFQLPFLLFLSLLELPFPQSFGEPLVFQLCLSTLHWNVRRVHSLVKEQIRIHKTPSTATHKKIALQTASKEFLLPFAQYDGL